MMTLCLGMAAAAPVMAQKGKPAPQPAIVNWRCDVEMRDASDDAIVSDRDGKYVDGEGGFICAMSPPESAAAGNPAPGSGNFYLGRQPERSFLIPARPGGWAAASATGLQIRVFNLVDMPLGTQSRAMAIPTSPIGAMYADDLGSGDPATDLVTVERTDACTWVVTFDVPSAAVQRYASLDRKRLIDTPQLPLGYTLTTRAPAGSSISACPAVPVP